MSIEGITIQYPTRFDEQCMNCPVADRTARKVVEAVAAGPRDTSGAVSYYSNSGGRATEIKLYCAGIPGNVR